MKNTRQKPTAWYLRPAFLWPMGIALCVFVTFWPALQNGFFNMDDLPLIQRNRLLLHHSLVDIQEIFTRQLWTPHYKPLVYMSWMLERDVFGINASVMHFNNMLLHAMNAVLLFFFIVRLLPRIWKTTQQAAFLVGGFSALLWALHPLRVESVAWAVERKDVLFSLFFLLACHAWLSHTSSVKGWKWLMLAAICYGMACLSKSMAITFPASALLLDFFTRRSSRIVVWDKLPLIAVLLSMLFLYGYLGIGDSTEEIDPMRKASALPGNLSGLPSILQHALIANLRLCLFIGHTLLPVCLSVVYPRELFLESIGAGIFFLPLISIGLLLFAWRKKVRRSPFAFAVAWFVITLSPILSGEGIGTNFMSDRYTYIPSIALTLGIVLGIHRLCLACQGTGQKAGKYISLIALGTLVFVFIIVSRNQTQVWRTNSGLWQQAIDHYPDNWFALYNRAKLKADENLSEALGDLQTAIVRMPGIPALHYARGTLLMQANKTEEAIADFDQVLAKEPGHLEALINRGNCLRILKRTSEAITDYHTALRISPKARKALNNRGLAYADLGKYVEAALDFDMAIKSDPEYASPYLNRANLRLRPDVANYAGAIEDFNAYLRLIPQSHEALFRRGYAKLRMGRAAAALQDIDAAIQLHDREGYYYIGRAQVYETLGNPAEAQRDLQKGRSLGAR